MSRPFGPLPAAPVAEKRPFTDTRHGIERSDDYAWLRADNWQEVFKDTSVLDQSIRAHLEAENAYQDAAMADTKELQKVLFEEMKGRIKEDDSTVPMPDGPYAYGSSYRKGGQQPLFQRMPRDKTAEADRTIILDGDAEADGKAYFRIASADHSPDHGKLLWGYDDKGSEFFRLRVRDMESRGDTGLEVEVDAA
mgnify:CR=1 FL=1